MMLKKMFRVIPVLLIALTALGACGSAQKNPGSSDGYFPEIPEAPTDPVEPVPPEVPETPEVPEKPDDPQPPEDSAPPQPPEIPSEDAFYAYYISSDTAGLNIRSGAGAQFASLGQMDRGDMLRYVSEEGDWYRTVYLEKTAYVSKRYAHIERVRKATADTERVISLGETLLGAPYVLGAQRYHWGNGSLNTAFQPGVFDCSSFTQYIFYKGAGVLLDVTTRTQILQGAEVSNWSRGDLLFFTNASRVDKVGIDRVGHVAVYLGEGYILHTASDYAVIEPISDQRRSYFIAAKRLI